MKKYLVVAKSLVSSSVLVAAAFASCLLMPVAANSATATANLVVTLTITANCTISASTVPFGTTSSLLTAINQTGNVNVTCTNTTPYTVGLDGGNVAASTVNARLMAGTTTGNTTTTIPYQLYSDTGRTSVWGNTSGTWVTGTGSGAAQTLIVYGQVPTATITPKPDAYQSTVVATITF